MDIWLSERNVAIDGGVILTGPGLLLALLCGSACMAQEYIRNEETVP